MVGVFLLGGRLVCGVLALLEGWFAVLVCGGCGGVAVLAVVRRVGRGGGFWAGGPLCGLRCGAQPWGGGAELTALCRGQSSVQTAAPSLMLKCA